MTIGGSQQLRIFRRAIRDGRTLTDAAIEAGMSMSEARSWANDDLKNPPPPECFELLNTAPVGAPHEEKENDMARPKKAAAAVINGEVPKPDFDRADEIYTNDIAPANSDQKRAMKDASDGWKEVRREARVNVAGYRSAMRVAGMEEAEQQAWLRAFNGGLKKRGVVLESDLVDQAEGKPQENVVPIGKAKAPQMATMPQAAPAGDTDLGDGEEIRPLGHSLNAGDAVDGEIVDEDPLGLEEHSQAAE